MIRKQCWTVLLTTLLPCFLGNAVADKADNWKVVSEIRELGEKYCNMPVFSNAESDLLVLRSEWGQIEKQAAELYIRNFPKRPKPKGTFVADMVEDTKKAHAFYSHNKHYEALVAEALIGPQRQHFEFGQKATYSPYSLQWISPDYYLEGTKQVDYKKLSRDIVSVFESQGLGDLDDLKVRFQNGDNCGCYVYSPWKSLQRVNGIDYQQRYFHLVIERDGPLLTPEQAFKGGFSRMQFLTNVQIRRAGGKVTSNQFLLGCTLLASDVPSNLIDSLECEDIAWVLNPDKKLELTESDQETESDQKYERKIANDTLNCSARKTAQALQKAISAKVRRKPADGKDN